MIVWDEIRGVLIMKKFDLPIVYSCSGCSSAVQIVNMIALKMDRDYVSEMSCIAGGGGDVKPKHHFVLSTFNVPKKMGETQTQTQTQTFI